MKPVITAPFVRPKVTIPRFGLKEVDYTKQTRKISPLARRFEVIIKSRKMIF